MMVLFKVNHIQSTINYQPLTRVSGPPMGESCMTNRYPNIISREINYILEQLPPAWNIYITSSNQLWRQELQLPKESNCYSYPRNKLHDGTPSLRPWIQNLSHEFARQDPALPRQDLALPKESKIYYTLLLWGRLYPSTLSIWATR